MTFILGDDLFSMFLPLRVNADKISEKYSGN
jgi:hypothetical protein